jgi:membrane protein DedA with SNARE-associated domain
MLVLASSVTGFITDWVTAAIGDYGIYAVFTLMLIDAVFPAASELVMVYSGALAAGAFASDVVLFGYEFESGWWAWLAMMLAGTIGYTIGAVIGWAIGLYGGRPWLDRHGRWVHLPPHRLEKAEHWFDRWGEWAVFIGRVTPVARSFVSIPAGVFRQHLGRYTVFTAIGSTLWCIAFAAVGYGFGTRWETFHRNFHYVDYAVAAGIVLFVAYLLVRRRRSSTLSRRASDPAR